MESTDEVKIPEAPEKVEGANEEFIVVPPIKSSGSYVKPGDILYCLDIGPVILEIESKHQGQFEHTAFSIGNIVKPGQLIGSINFLANEPKPSILTTANITSFFLGIIFATVVFSIITYGQ